MASHPGRVRRGNEDACAADPEQGIVAVCDGVGGAARGEVASRLAADSLVHFVRTSQGSSQQMSVRSRLLAAVQAANAQVHERAKQQPQFYGMATTLVALYLDRGTASSCGRETVWVANVGDSRCYRLREQRFEQLTLDHSVVEEQVRAGQITRAQAEVSPIRHVITRAIGSAPEVEADLYELEQRPGDLYLLTTDGLMRELADDEIAAILLHLPLPPDEAGLNTLCQRLVETAVAYGGNDNITCALIYMH